MGTNPYKTQNKSPAQKAIKTFTWNKQIQLTSCKYKYQNKLPVSQDEHHTAYTLWKLTYAIQEMDTCCHQWAAKTLDEHTQPILCTHLGTYPIQSDWNAAASYALSCPWRSWESTWQYQ